jgi:glycosyltransferase involved in cell wall biosynthesis
MTEPLRIAIVMTNAEQRGGSERLLQYLLRRADDSWRISIAFLEDGPMVEEARQHGHRVTVIPAPRFRQLVGTARCIWALRKWLKSQRPELVLGWMKKAHIYSGPAAAGIAPAVWFQHENPGNQGIDRLIHRIRAKGVLCCSDMVRKLQQEVTPGLAAKTIHPCQDVANEPTEEIAWPVPVGQRALVMVCRLQTWKGPHLAVQALHALRGASHPDLNLVIVGGAHSLEPDYPAFLEAEIAKYGMADFVHLVGFQSAPATWMRKADVVVHASHGEPFGMVVAEAIALGVPVVAARPGGPEEIVRQGIDGVLWNHPDTNDLARAIREAMALDCHPDSERFGVGAYLANLQSTLRGFIA